MSQNATQPLPTPRSTARILQTHNPLPLTDQEARVNTVTATRQGKAEVTIPVRLPRMTAEALRTRAQEHRVTTSELVRALLADAMAAWGIGDGEE